MKFKLSTHEVIKSQISSIETVLRSKMGFKKKLYIKNRLFDQNDLVKVFRPKMSDSYQLMI